jgi:hypothetical protein
MKNNYTFDDSTIPTAKEVDKTRQLEPRTSKPPFESSNNELKRYTKPHGPLGPLGDKSVMGGGK